MNIKEVAEHVGDWVTLYYTDGTQSEDRISQVDSDGDVFLQDAEEYIHCGKIARIESSLQGVSPSHVITDDAVSEGPTVDDLADAHRVLSGLEQEIKASQKWNTIQKGLHIANRRMDEHRSELAEMFHKLNERLIHVEDFLDSNFMKFDLTEEGED